MCAGVSGQSIHGVGTCSYWVSEENQTIDEVNNIGAARIRIRSLISAINIRKDKTLRKKILNKSLSECLARVLIKLESLPSLWRAGRNAVWRAADPAPRRTSPWVCRTRMRPLHGTPPPASAQLLPEVSCNSRALQSASWAFPPASGPGSR